MGLRELLIGGADVESKTLNTGLMTLRATGIALAFAHGIGKIPPGEGFIGAITDLGFPFPAFFAWSAGLSEFLCSLLVALGLLTRPAAAFMLITMLVAYFGQHAADPFKVKELAFLYAFIALTLALTGAGRLSLDHIVRGKLSTHG